jgi:hypothetical protein
MITTSVISRTVKRRSAGIFSRTWATPSSLRAVESQPGTQIIFQGLLALFKSPNPLVTTAWLNHHWRQISTPAKFLCRFSNFKHKI